MKTIHLYAGTGLRIVRCLESELAPEYQGKPGTAFPVLEFGWGIVELSQDRKATDRSVRLVFDTRYLNNLDQVGEERRALGDELSIVLHPVMPSVNAALVVDLGNTRSFGLVLDDIGRPDAMRFYPLRIRDYSAWTDTFTTTGVFQSHICLEMLQTVSHPDRGGDEARYGRPLSGLRTGAAARSLRNQVTAFNPMPGGRVSQISPKRFFWDHDPVRYKWMAGCVATSSLVSPSGILFDKWMDELKVPTESMPPSTLLGAMVVEMFEQAEMQLNDAMDGDGESAQGPRRIRHVAITYPPAWSRGEREAYQRVIQKHLDAYCDERGLDRARVRISCDEATGTLMAYISNEVEKFGGQLYDWIVSIGSIDAEGNGRARFAVLDIGGGTSDLIMAEVSVIRERLGLHYLQINRFYQDGVLVAGDELLRKVVAGIVLPAVAKAICPENADARCRLFAFAVSGQRSDEYLKVLRSRWAQSCWFPIAVEIVQAWQDERKINLLEIKNDLDLFCKDCLFFINTVLKLNRVVFTGLGTDDKPNNGEIVKYLQNMPIKREALQAICAEVFSDAAIRFGLPIAAARCDRVLLSGKTTEFEDVRNVLKQHIPLPEFKFISFGDYKLAPKWIPVAGRNGSSKLSDVKMTTVMGAALELCNERGHQVFGLTSKVTIADAHDFSDAKQYWGIVPASAIVPTFKNMDAIFPPGEGDKEQCIPIQGQSVLLARRRSQSERMTAQISYELRVKPHLGACARGTAILQRHVRSDGAVELKLVGVAAGGRIEYANGDQVELLLDHLELRQMVAQNVDFWMMDGNIQEEINWV